MSTTTKTPTTTAKQKNRMSQVDIRAIVAELKKEIVGLRLSNIYDLNSKTYMLKFAKPDHKIHLLVESGIRLHTTKFERDKSQMPSAFTLKLRKYIRTRRCEKVDQLGVDRVIDIQFGQEDKSYHLIIEFFAKGNIILTDPNYQILTLLRTHKKEKETAGVFAVGENYPMGARRQFTAITRDALLNIFRENKDEKVNLKNLLGNSTDYGPGFTEHVILKSGLKPSTKYNEMQQLKQFIADQSNSEGQKIFDSLMKGFQEADNFISFKEDAVQRGYIILADEKQETKDAQTTSEENNNKELTKQEQLDLEKQEKDKQRERYEDFTPFLYQQYVNRPFLMFDTFDHAVDEYFSAVETMKLDNQKSQVESSVYKKLHKIKQEQENRIKELEQDKTRLELYASLIEQNLDLVDAAIEIIVSGVSDYSWEEIDRVVKTQKKLGDPVATAIHQLKLENNTIVMNLTPQEEEFSDEEEEERDLTPQKVEIDISLTAYGNAQFYYSLRKKSNEKQEKTVAASKKAIKVAEKKTVEALKQKQIKAEIQLMRKKFWWEKFNWFISSENYLVLSGRDALQNEMLVKRYMRKGDIYVHADVHGASTCIVKNHTYDSSIDENVCTVPPQTLHEAGMMTVCRSSAWDAKIVANAYWVHAHQVSKSAPTGEYLPTGSFMVRGKKNYLPPCQLVMGLAVMFKIDEESIPNHLGERKRKDLTNDDAVSVMSMESASTWEEESINSPRSTTSNEEANGNQQAAAEDNNATDEQDEDENNDTEEQKEENQDESNEASKSDEDEQESTSGTTKENQPKKKKGLSAKDKKKLKKLKKQGMDEKEAKQMLLSETHPTTTSQVAEKKSNNIASADIPQHKPKGMKKGKWKKMKKYADQDEEERRLRMELIGHKYVSPTEKLLKKQEEEQIQQESIEKQKQENEIKKKEKEEIKKLLEDENIQYMDDEEREKLTEIDALTGQPREDDIILFAVPVCAPYNTLRNYKYKVKIIPGNQKRGKAGTQAMHLLVHEAKQQSTKEETLIKSVSEPEVTAVMVGNCRIATSTSASKKKNTASKSSKKSSSKNV